MNLLSLALAVALQGGGRAPPPPVAGCVMLRIDVAGGRRVGVSAERGHGCGPLTIIADSNATFDPARHLLRLRLSIVNGWAREVALPARIRSWNDSITIATWGGMPPSVPREAVRFVGEEVAWSYDSLLGGAKANRVLMPGQHSNARTIDMLVRTSEPVAFYVVLRAEAQNAHPLPEYPPQHTASDYLTGERVVVDGWRLPSGRVLAEVVEMRFDSNASPQERQAAVDSLRGTVIGATAPSGLDERIYFVRLPADSARPPIISIVERGRGFWPQYVRPIVIDSLLAPGQGRSPLFLSPVIGCTTLRIRLTGGAGLNVDSIHAPGCGPIVPVLTLGASYDPNTRVIRLPIALENRWTRQVVTPARLFAWNDSIEVLPSMPPSPPSGRSPPAPVPGHPLPPRPPPAPRPPWLRLPDPRAKWLDSDSAIGAGAKLLSGARLWRYDSSVTAMSGRGVLAPLERSADRMIELQLDTAKIDEITVRLRAQAENAHFVPALPPLDAERVGSFDISHRIADPPGLHAMPVVADLIDVTFAGGSTQEERQSVVDSVRGEVVGGYRRTDRGDGTYVVRIPFDSTGAGLVTALGIIRAQPGFILAMPLDAENGPMRYAPY